MCHWFWIHVSQFSLFITALELFLETLSPWNAERADTTRRWIINGKTTSYTRLHFAMCAVRTLCPAHQSVWTCVSVCCTAGVIKKQKSKEQQGSSDSTRVGTCTLESQVRRAAVGKPHWEPSGVFVVATAASCCIKTRLRGGGPCSCLCPQLRKVNGLHLFSALSGTQSAFLMASQSPVYTPLQLQH